MPKVIPGASREALNFIGLHWQSLLKMSVVPIAIYLLGAVFQYRAISGFYRTLGPMMQGGQIDPAFWGAYTRGMSLAMLTGFIGIIALVWLFVAIIRFHRNGEAPWLILDGAGAKACLLTFLYGLGIMLLTLLAYLAAVIALVVPLAILAAIGGAGSEAGGIILAILMIPAVFGIFLFLYWFIFRFLVGLPGVALGHSPDFFRDLWSLSKGESWAVPLRMFFATLIAYVPITIFFFVFLWPTFGALFTRPELESNPAEMFAVLADMMDRMVPFTAAMMLVFVPFLWFSTLLLAIAFQRFLAKQKASA